MTTISPLHAGEKGTGDVSKRTEVMKLMAGKMQMLSQVLRGEIYFKTDAVKHAAKELQDKSGAHLTSFFPKGSTGSKSLAKPAIWQDWKTFETYATTLQSAAQNFGTVAASVIEKGDVARAQKEMPRGSYADVDRKLMARAMADMKLMQTAFVGMAKNCRGCHEKFKKKKEKK